MSARAQEVPPRPNVLPPNIDGIPSGLTELPRFMGWKNELKDGRWTKVPKKACGGLAKSQDPKTWTDFQSIEAAYNERIGVFDGIGIALGQCGDCYLVGIDVDSCMTSKQLGQIDPWAVRLVDTLIDVGAYLELSPSGTGMKAMFFLSIDDVHEARKAFDMLDGDTWGFKRSIQGTNGKDHGPGVELYFTGRYFTLTGARHDRCAIIDTMTILDLDQVLRIAEVVPQKKTSDNDNPSSGSDKSRSAAAFRLGCKLRREGKTFEEMCKGIADDPETADWYRTKGTANGNRELKRIWNKAEPREWIEHCQKNDKGQPRSNLANVMTALREAPELQRLLAFNEMQLKAVILRRPPGGVNGGEYPRPLRDDDITATQEWLQRAGLTSVGEAIVRQAIERRARDSSFHPIRDYLNSLKWDGEERVGKLFQKYYNADLPKDQREKDRHVAYLEHISTGFMVGAVARVMFPGCKHDHVPVLVSNNQGLLKSSSILALCAYPIWFADNLPPDLSDRDTKEFLRGKWLIELSEIPHVRREVERVKAFVASATDRYREPYVKFNQDHPRQCAFIGTSNDLEFADVTGNRRFWPFTLSKAVDVEGITRDRDQLWAEAADLYRRGAKWWLPPNIEKIAAERQKAFVEADLWDDLISSWLDSHPGPFTMENLFARQTGITPYRETAATPRADEMRAARCLKRLGWHKTRCTLNGVRAVWWQPGGGAD